MLELTFGSLCGSVLFGAIGMAAVAHGKREGAARPLGCGLALLAFPSLCSSTWLMYLVGGALTLVTIRTWE